MIYVLDTNIIRKIWFHLPRKGQMFEKIWKAFEDCIDKGEIGNCQTIRRQQFF